MYSGENFILLQNIPKEDKGNPLGTLRMNEHEWSELSSLGSIVQDFFYAVEYYHSSDTTVISMFDDAGDVQKHINGGFSCTYPVIENNLFLIFRWNSDDHSASVIIKRVIGNENDKIYMNAANAFYLFGTLDEKVDKACQMWTEMHEVVKTNLPWLLATPADDDNK